MKTKHLLEHFRQQEGEILAYFGDARFVKSLNGKIELRGGSPDDRTAAREWCSLFMHQAVISAG